MIPEIAELAQYFSMFVTVNSLRHNPTVKNEAQQRGGQDMYYGFLGYPVSQAADIAICKATLVPAGDDQIPHIEQARKIVRRFNELYRPVLPEPRILQGGRLTGLDGNSKMSKSLDNALYLDSSAEEVSTKLVRAKTDPARIRKHDPGHPDICPVYEYHRYFRQDDMSDIHEQCSKGAIGCTDCKRLAAHAVNMLLEPMRERRHAFAARMGDVDEILIEGTRKARTTARETMSEVRDAMGIGYFRR